MRRPGRLSFLDAAERVLREAAGPLHANEICDRALRQGLIETSGRPPHDSMAAARAATTTDASQCRAEGRLR